MGTEFFIFGQGDLWQVLTDRNIDAISRGPNTGLIKAWVSRDNHIKFEDGTVGAGDAVSALILMAPDVSNGIANKVIQVAREHQLPVGFTIHHARNYEKIYLVDPGSERFFPAEDIFVLTNDEIDVERIQSESANDIADELETKIGP
jgi:hypothetical protein